MILVAIRSKTFDFLKCCISNGYKWIFEDSAESKTIVSLDINRSLDRLDQDFEWILTKVSNSKVKVTTSTFVLFVMESDVSTFQYLPLQIVPYTFCRLKKSSERKKRCLIFISQQMKYSKCHLLYSIRLNNAITI